MANTGTLETYRSLRDTIKNATGDKPLRSILIVDVDRKSPSDVAVQLAEAFSDAGERCALIETNFRNSDGQKPGLSDMLSESGATYKPGESDGLIEIGPGTVGNPDLLASKSFPTVLVDLVSQFDYAILTCDGYPGSGDAIAVGPAVDAVILVISAGVTGREPAIRARDALERVGARILGMVMIERPRRWF